MTIKRLYIREYAIAGLSDGCGKVLFLVNKKSYRIE